MIIYNSFKNARILGMFENKIIKNGYMRRHAVESSWWWWIFVSNGHYDHGHRRRTISLQIISTLYIKTHTHTHIVCVFFSIFPIPSSFPIQILNTNTHHAHFVLFCVLLFDDYHHCIWIMMMMIIFKVCLFFWKFQILFFVLRTTTYTKTHTHGICTLFNHHYTTTTTNNEDHEVFKDNKVHMDTCIRTTQHTVSAQVIATSAFG